MSGYTITLTDREYDAMKERIVVLEAVLLSARSRMPHVILPSEMAACFPRETPPSGT